MPKESHHRNRLLESLAGVNPDLDAVATLGEEARPWIETALGGDNLSLATRAVRLAGKIGARDLLDRAWQDPRASVRTTALIAMRSRGALSSQVLEAAVADVHPAVRLQAAHAITDLGGGAALDRLRAMQAAETESAVTETIDTLIDKIDG